MIGIDEKERFARNAVEEFVQYSCVFLSSGADGTAAIENGSGIVIRTKGGNYCVLTAKHIAEEAVRNQYRIGFYKALNLIPDFVAAVVPFLGDVDVGLLVVKNQLALPFEKLAVTQDVIPIVGQTDIASEDSLIVNGYPFQTIRFNIEEGLQAFELLTYWFVPENITHDDDGRYRLEWKDAVGRNNDEFDLPVPGGMSGGPLWRFRKPESRSVWAVGEIARIVAIQSAWDRKETLFLEPVEKWSRWFHESCASIDKRFEKNHAEMP